MLGDLWPCLFDKTHYCVDFSALIFFPGISEVAFSLTAILPASDHTIFLLKCRTRLFLHCCNFLREMGGGGQTVHFKVPLVLFITHQGSKEIFADRFNNYILQSLLIQTCDRNYEPCSALHMSVKKLIKALIIIIILKHLTVTVSSPTQHGGQSC